VHILNFPGGIPAMTRYGLVCLLFSALAWGQAATPQSPASPAPQAPAATNPAASPAAAPATPAEVAPDTAVITIACLGDNPPADKSSAADCKTVITRAQFEVILSSVAPNMPAAQRRRFASSYVNALVMAKNAEKEGLDKGANYEEQMKLMRVRVLAQ